jgi:hypothetical protein
MELGGDLRLVTPSRLVRLLRYATGLEFLAVLGRGLGRMLLRTERRGQLRLDGDSVRIVHTRSILGRAVFEQATLLPARELVSISVFDGRAELLQSAGLGALAAGTLLGTGLLVEGLRTPGLAPSLVTLGLLLVATGGAVDFVLERLIARTPGPAPAKLRIVPARGPAFLFSGLEPQSARAWLDAAKIAIVPPAPPG